MALMNHITTNHTPTIESVQEQFEVWRSKRAKKREPIPTHLWHQAAELCRVYSISRVSRQLRLSYSELKLRALDKPSPAVQFMEIDVNALSDRWQIECRRPDGGQLLMSGSTLPAIEAIVKAFIS